MVNTSTVVKGMMIGSFIVGTGCLIYLAAYGNEDDKQLATKIIKTVKTVKIS